MKNYDSEAETQIRRLEKDEIDFETYVFGEPEPKDFCLIDDKISYGRGDAGRRAVLGSFLEDMSSFIKGRSFTVVEFGSGTGRNILYLKTKFPRCRFIGLELSPKNVDLSRKASEKWGIEAEFHVSNVAETIPALPDDVQIAFSYHALEMMPRIFTKALDHMMNSSSGKVVLYEPVSELYHLGLRGLLSRYRAIYMDRMRGMTSFLKGRNCCIDRMERMKNAGNPLNETCRIVLASGK